MRIELKLYKKTDIANIAEKLKNSDLKAKILDLYNANDYKSINYETLKGLGNFYTNDNFMTVSGGYDDCYKMTIRPRYNDERKLIIFSYDTLARKLVANNHSKNKAAILDKWFNKAIDEAIDTLTRLFLQDIAYEALDDFITELVDVKSQMALLITDMNNIAKNGVDSYTIKGPFKQSFNEIAKKTRSILINTINLSDKLVKKVITEL